MIGALINVEQKLKRRPGKGKITGGNKGLAEWADDALECIVVIRESEGADWSSFGT
jgi:hypothetical protein